MLRWRLLFGTIFVAALMGLVILDHNLATPGALLFPLAIAVTPLAAAEMLRLTSVRDQLPARWVVYPGSLLVVVANGVPHWWPDYPSDCPLGIMGWPLGAFTAAVLLAIVGELIRFDKPEGLAKNLALTVLCIGYAGLFLGFIVQLRFVGGAAWNTVPLISLLVIVKASDTGAYTVGRLAGRHKLAPKISPGKTIEGLIGGVLFACVGAWFVFVVIGPRITEGVEPVAVWRWMFYALILTFAGVAGDLSVSLLKRDSGYKDSSTWLPGLGGVLDMMDSLLVSAPVAWFLWIVLFRS